MRVPKPPKKKEISPDKRMEYLLGWKKLFEEISPEIKVFIDGLNNNSEEFRKDWEGRVGYLLGIHSSDAEIFVCFPREVSQRYLVGWSHNHMFSDLEIEADPVIQEENEMEVSYEPETKPWEHWYKEICKQYESLHTSIPVPPNESAGE